MATAEKSPGGLPASAEALYRAALGPMSARHHLPAIARFEERGRTGAGWCASAARGHLGWLVFWRLWDVALAMAAATVAGAGALGYLWHRADSLPVGVRAGLTVTAVVFWWSLPAFWGIGWLHRGLRERVAQAVAEAETLDGALEALRRSESAWYLRGLAAAVAAVVVTVSLAAVAWLWWRAPVAAVTKPGLAAAPAAAVSAPPVSPIPGGKPAPPPAPPPSASMSPEARPPAPASPPMPSAPAAVAPTSMEDGLGVADPIVPALRPRVKGYGVNVGMFAVAANAERVEARLQQAGLPVLADPVESARGTLTRVRVGPFEHREQAEAAARKVKALGLEARVYAP